MEITLYMTRESMVKHANEILAQCLKSEGTVSEEVEITVYDGIDNDGGGEAILKLTNELERSGEHQGEPFVAEVER